MKNVKTYKMLLVVLMVLFYSGCTRTVYVDKPVPYAVPQACEVRLIECHLSGSPSNMLLKSIECFLDQKEEAKVCSKEYLKEASGNDKN